MISFISALVGAVIGSASSIITLLIQEKRRDARYEQEQRDRQRQLASAFLGEVSAIRKLILFRGYLPNAEANLKRLEAGEDVPLLAFKVRYSYDSVFGNNVAQIGCLPMPIPEKVATFYAVMYSLLEDVTAWGDFDTRQLPIECRVKAQREFAVLLSAFLTLAESLITDLSGLCGAAPYGIPTQSGGAGQPQGDEQSTAASEAPGPHR